LDSRLNGEGGVDDDDDVVVVVVPAVDVATGFGEGGGDTATTCGLVGVKVLGGVVVTLVVVVVGGGGCQNYQTTTSVIDCAAVINHCCHIPVQCV
jgi:hypothetical protein